MGIYFIITNIHIQIKQQFYLQNMNLKTYQNYDAMLRTILEHVDEIVKFNAFFSKYVTVMILFYGLIGTSLLNAVTSSRAPKGTAVLLIVWGSFACFYLQVIYLYCFSSSRTIFFNRLLYFKLRSLQVALCSSRIVKFTRQMIHLDLMNEYKMLLLRFSCFRLATTSPLNHKLFFFEIGVFISSLYMKIISRR